MSRKKLHTQLTNKQKHFVQAEQGNRTPEQLAKALSVPVKLIERELQQAPTTPTAPHVSQPPPPPESTGMSMASQGLVAWCAIIAAGFAAYWNSFHNAMLWDDFGLVRDNRFLQGWQFVDDIFRTDLFGGVNQGSTFYRPLQAVTYLVDHTFWQLEPFGYHLTNTVLHIMVALLLFALVFKLSRRVMVSAIAGVLYVVHPIHTEAITYIAGRADPLVAAFSLCAAVIYLHVHEKRIRSRWWIALSLGSFGLAMLSKEMGVFLPAGLLVLDRLVVCRGQASERTWKATVMRLMPYLGVLLLYVIIRPRIVPWSNEATQSSVIPTEYRLLLMPLVFLTYLRLLVVPTSLHMERDLPAPASFGDPQVVGAAIAVMVLIVLAVWWARRSQMAQVGLVWFAVWALPISGVFPLNAQLAEHWLYIPSMGLVWCAALGFEWLVQDRRWRGLGWALLVGVVVVYAAMTAQRNTEWADVETFFRTTIERATPSSRLHGNLGDQLSAEERYEEAIIAYEQALEIDSSKAGPMIGLGGVYHKLGRLPEAQRILLRARRLEPDKIGAIVNLAIVYADLGQTEKEILLRQEIVERQPWSFESQMALAIALTQAGRHSEAMTPLNEASALRPSSHGPYNARGIVNRRLGNMSAAIRDFQRSIELDPTFAQAYYNLGNTYADQRRWGEARQAYEQALAIQPDLAEAKTQLMKLPRG